MTYDYKQLCAELVDELEGWVAYGDEIDIANAHVLIDRTRTALAKPEPEPVAWIYQGEPSFDGSDWQETWEVTTDKRLAEFKAAPDQPIPLFSNSPQRQ